MDDLVRRDFTVNAMAEREDGTLIDPFNGQRALEDKVLITPSDPFKTMLDDPLRVLRALRFSITKQFSIHEDVWAAMKDPDVLEKLEHTVSVERIREEVFKMMQKDTVATIKLLTKVDSEYMPKFLDLVFSKGLWLKPTFEAMQR